MDSDLAFTRNEELLLPSCPAETAIQNRKRKTPVSIDLDTAFLRHRQQQLAMTRPVFSPAPSHQSGFGSPILLSTPPSSSSSSYAEREEEEEPNTASGISHNSDDDANDDDDGPSSSSFRNKLCNRPPSGIAPISSTSFQRLRTSSEAPTTLPTGGTQLTIFYNGSVHVFDNISPEKARAINVVLGDVESCGTTNINATTTINTITTLRQNGGKAISPASRHEEPKQRIILVDDVSIEEKKKKIEATPASIEPHKNEAIVPSKPPSSLKAQELLHPRKISLARFLSKRKEWMDRQGEGSNGLSSQEAKSKPDL